MLWAVAGKWHSDSEGERRQVYLVNVNATLYSARWEGLAIPTLKEFMEAAATCLIA